MLHSLVTTNLLFVLKHTPIRPWFICFVEGFALISRLTARTEWFEWWFLNLVLTVINQTSVQCGVWTWTSDPTASKQVSPNHWQDWELQWRWLIPAYNVVSFSERYCDDNMLMLHQRLCKSDLSLLSVQSANPCFFVYCFNVSFSLSLYFPKDSHYQGEHNPHLTTKRLWKPSPTHLS